MNPRVLELLVKEGLLTQDQAQRALADQKRTGERLTTSLTRLGYLKEEDLLDFLSDQAHLEGVAVHIRTLPAELDAAQCEHALQRMRDNANVFLEATVRRSVVDAKSAPNRSAGLHDQRIPWSPGVAVGVAFHL